MTDDKVRRAFELCGQVLARAGAWSDRGSPNKLNHTRGLCDAAPALLNEGRREKAMRWLGFVQGVLYASGLATVDELKQMNMPDEATPEDPT